MSGIQTLKIEPSAYNLIESIRSIGYSFETALADILDNSISAKCDLIEIFLRNDEDDNYIQIFDNGHGMSEDELINAMRLGSKNPTMERDKSDLGRFGLGLKSSSFSQCKQLTVVSKKDNNYSALKWDLDLVAKTDRFEVLKLSDEQIFKIENIKVLENYVSGTLVMWEAFDRVEQTSNSISQELSKLMDHTIDHISLIYHRYLNDNLSIYVNNNKIEPKDPFLKYHPGTQFLQEKQVIIDNEIIELAPFVLPHYSNLSAKDKRLSGRIRDQYSNQGFYVYRNKRLII